MRFCLDFNKRWYLTGPFFLEVSEILTSSFKILPALEADSRPPNMYQRGLIIRKKPKDRLILTSKFTGVETEAQGREMV